VAAGTALVVAGLGGPLGLLWASLAPSVPVRMTADGALLVETQPEEFIAADGWFALLGAGFGGLAAIVVWLLFRGRRGPLLLVAVTIGAVAAGLLAWWVGRRVGLAEYERMLADAPRGTVFGKPADLRSADAELRHGFLPLVRGAVLVPGMAAAVFYTLLAGWSRFPTLRPDEERHPHDWEAAERAALERDAAERAALEGAALGPEASAPGGVERSAAEAAAERSAVEAGVVAAEPHEPGVRPDDREGVAAGSPPPAEPAAAGSEAGPVELVLVEPAQVESGLAEVGLAEPPPAELVVVEPDQVEPGQVEVGRIELDRAELAPEPGQPDLVLVEPDQVEPGQVEVGRIELERIDPDHAELVLVEPGEVEPGEVEPGEPVPAQPGPDGPEPGQATQQRDEELSSGSAATPARPAAPAPPAPDATAPPPD
jgi:hypothetical protein